MGLFGKNDDRREQIKKEAREAEKEAYYGALKVESLKAAKARGAKRAKSEAQSGHIGVMGGLAKIGEGYQKAGKFAAPIAANFDAYYGATKGKRKKQTDPFAGMY